MEAQAPDPGFVILGFAFSRSRRKRNSIQWVFWELLLEKFQAHPECPIVLHAEIYKACLEQLTMKRHDWAMSLDDFLRTLHKNAHALRTNVQDFFEGTGYEVEIHGSKRGYWLVVKPPPPPTGRARRMSITEGLEGRRGGALRGSGQAPVPALQMM